MVDIHPKVWNTMRFLKFEVFTKPPDPYIELVPKGKKKASALKPLDKVKGRGLNVKCNICDINIVLGML